MDNRTRYAAQQHLTRKMSGGKDRTGAFAHFEGMDTVQHGPATGQQGYVFSVCVEYHDETEYYTMIVYTDLDSDLLDSRIHGVG